MSHQSVFTFRQRGGESAGETWIHDGEDPIARFEHRTIDQPEQMLRYFDGNSKPVNLRDLKLAPGGRPLIAGVQLFWVFEHTVLATTDLVSVDVQGQDTDCLTMTVITRDPFGVATSTRVLTLTYNEELGSYVYDFAANLEIHSPESFDREEEVHFEYCDPWYNDIPAPTIDFPGMWPKRFSHLLAEAQDNTVWQMPLNHMATGIPRPLAFKRDGLFVLANHPGNNPAFEFVGDTADRTTIGVCNWGYDIHFEGRYTRDELYAPICPRFRMRLCPDDAVGHLIANAQPVPVVEHNGFTTLPNYERSCSFESGVNLSQPSPGETDAFPWLPEGSGCEWCRDEGRSDSHSLKISKDSGGPSEWMNLSEAEGMFTEKWTAIHGFRVTGYIKTENTRGRGAFLALRWGTYNIPERYPFVCSEKITGTTDWVHVNVEIRGPGPAAGGLLIYFRQDGPGTSWLDDLEVEVLAC